MTRLALPRRVLAGTAGALAIGHPHGCILQALICQGALAIETPSPERPGHVDLRSLVQLDGDLVTAVSPELIAAPATGRAALERHGQSLARCREILESELAGVLASMGHLWMAGTAAWAIIASQTAPVQALLVAACGPAFRLGWRGARRLLLRRSIRVFARRVAGTDR